jgi:hypothetical protein
VTAPLHHASGVVSGDFHPVRDCSVAEAVAGKTVRLAVVELGDSASIPTGSRYRIVIGGCLGSCEQVTVACETFADVNDQGTRFTIQVKALRSPNYFLIDLERVQDACYYVFVVLNKPDVPPDYYIVSGCDLRSNPAKFGKWFADYKKMPGIHPKDLAEYRNNWKVFGS